MRASTPGQECEQDSPIGHAGEDGPVRMPALIQELGILMANCRRKAVMLVFDGLD